MTSVMKFFIPKIADHVSKETIKTTFEKLLIGSISEIDMYRKKTRNGTFWYAFIAVDLYKTECANAVFRTMKEKGSTKIVYDEPAYWEIRNYIPIEERVSKNEIKDICYELMNKPLIPKNTVSLYCKNPNTLDDFQEIYEESIVKPSPYLIPKNTVSLYHKKSNVFTLDDFQEIANDYDEFEKELFGPARVY